MKTIVITGASSGIGQACLEACLAAGHQVIATARKLEDLQRIEVMGAQAVALELLDETSVQQAAKDILKLADGHIDVLFNNAGYGLQVAMEDTTWQSLADQHTANVIGPIMLTNQLLTAIPKGGSVVFNGSILGLITLAFRGPYCMSKHAMEAAVDAYRLELEHLGIGVHLIQPGPIEARFRANTLVASQKALADKSTRLDYRHHLERLGSSDNMPGTLPAASVAEVFMGIVSGRKQKSRYLVTRTAKTVAVIKRILGAGFHRLARKSYQVCER